MTAIEPGDSFTIEYGKGHRLEVVALNGRQRIQCMRIIGAMQSASESGNFEHLADAQEKLEQAVRICSPSITDEQLARLDDQLSGDIIFKTLGKAQVDGEEAKKSG